MISELSSILLSSFSTLTVSGIGGGILFYRQHKEKKALENQIQKVEVEKAQIAAKQDTWHLYQEQLDAANHRIKDLLEINADKETKYSERVSELGKRYSDRINEVEERFNKQTNFLRGVQRELTQSIAEKNELIAKIGKQQRIIDHLRQWLCIKPWKVCQVRKPQQAVKPTKYVPLEEYDAETVSLIQETLEIQKHAHDCECEICMKEKKENQ